MFLLINSNNHSRPASKGRIVVVAVKVGPTSDPREGYMTCGWTGSAAQLLERYPLLITKTCCHTHLYDDFWRKTTHFYYFSPFLDNPPMFMEKLPKKGPLFREFWAEKPTHVGGTYPYPQHAMYPQGSEPLCWPPYLSLAPPLGISNLLQ